MSDAADLIAELARQAAWRDWGPVLDALPPLAGRTVLDLGCAIGDQTSVLASRGARVVGCDLNLAWLAHARRRELPRAAFLAADLRALPLRGGVVDGIWSSFAAAYLVDLASALCAWKRVLRPGGWIALTEIDDLLGHGPLSPQAASLLADYAREAFEARRYDFHMGRKLRLHLEQAGLCVERELDLLDAELSFQGPAAPEVVQAWARRLEHMTLLRARCGAGFGEFQREFLACLGSAGQRSTARVVCCIARA